MTIHRVAMCRCGHDLHPGALCSLCGCTHSVSRGSPVRSEQGRANSDMLNDLRVVLRNVEIAALTLHRQAKAWGAAVDRESKASRSRGTRPTADSAGLGRCARTLLTVLAHRYGRTTSREQLAVLSGYSIDSSGFSNALGSLRSAGLLDGSTITEVGLRTVGRMPPWPTGHALLEMWSAKLPRCERAILACLWKEQREIDRDTLAEMSGYSPDSSGYSNALGRLRTLELVTRGHTVSLSPIFLEGT